MISIEITCMRVKLKYTWVLVVSLLSSPGGRWRISAWYWQGNAETRRKR